MKRLFEIAHDLLQDVIQPGDIAIDATAGNGFDTLFLAQHVGPTGHVHAFDIQPEAIAKTKQRLMEHAFDNATLFQRSHDEMNDAIPAEHRSHITVAMFNLGYRPGGPPTFTTRSDTTLVALVQAYLMLKPGGVLTVIAYRDHAGGSEEMDAVEAWLRSNVPFEQHDSALPHGPRLYAIRKL